MSMGLYSHSFPCGLCWRRWPRCSPRPSTGGVWCTFYRNVFSATPRGKMKPVTKMLKAPSMPRRAKPPPGKGQAGGSGAARHETERGCPKGGHQHRRNLVLHRFPIRALGTHPHQQRHRAAQPRDSPPHPGGRYLPRRQLRSCSSVPACDTSQAHSGETKNT